MAGVMSNHDTRFGSRIVLRKVFPGIIYQSLGSPANVVKIHCVGPNARELRTRAASLAACFNAGDNLPYRPPSQTSCAEGKRLEKTIVQLLPVFIFDQLFDRRSIHRVIAPRKELQNISRAARQQLAFIYG